MNHLNYKSMKEMSITRVNNQKFLYKIIRNDNFKFQYKPELFDKTNDIIIIKEKINSCC